MHELRDRVTRHDYTVDCARVAEALIARPGALSLWPAITPQRGGSPRGGEVQSRRGG